MPESLNPRMLKEGAFITDGTVLLRVEVVKKIGSFPSQRLLLSAVDAQSDYVIDLTEGDLKRRKFRLVEPCADEALVA